MALGIEGLDELADAIATWRDRIRSEAVPNTIQRSLEIAHEIASVEVPVRTGQLRDSIHVEQVDEFVGALIAAAPYAGFVEFGTSKMQAQPYMEPAARECERNVQNILQEELENALS